MRRLSRHDRDPRARPSRKDRDSSRRRGPRCRDAHRVGPSGTPAGGHKCIGKVQANLTKKDLSPRSFLDQQSRDSDRAIRVSGWAKSTAAAVRSAKGQCFQGGTPYGLRRLRPTPVRRWARNTPIRLTDSSRPPRQRMERFAAAPSASADGPEIKPSQGEQSENRVMVWSEGVVLRPSGEGQPWLDVIALLKQFAATYCGNRCPITPPEVYQCSSS